MSVLLTILWFFLALGILVSFHEFGHFYIARRCGVKVIRFSIGFGKPLLSWTDRLGTEYILAAIPLGGYVKMLDEREGEVAPNELSMSFTQKPVWQRMAIIIAGPLANFLLAIMLYFVLALMGHTGVAPVVGELPMDGLAATAGLRENDEIIAVDGQPVTTWSETFSRLVRRVGDTGAIQLDVKRHDSQNTFAERSLLLPIEHWLGDTQEPDFFHVLGIVRYMPDTEPVIQQVIANSAAALAGLQAQDRIVSVDGEPVLTWMQWVTYVRSKPESTMTLQVKRGEQLLAIALTPSSASESGQLVGKAGVTASITWPESMIRPIEYTLLGAVNNGIEKTWEQSTFILSFIKKLILAEVSTKNLSGSFTIAQVAGDSANAGLASYLAFLAFLSVSLGVFNLMPIPVLDGGHLLYYVIEVIKGSPVSEKIQVIGYQFGLFFVLSIMVVAHVNDLVRIFS